MIFEQEAGKNWNESVYEVSYTKEFAEANKSEGEVFFVRDNENKAIVVIKKKAIKLLSRAQIFTDCKDEEFLKEIISKLKKMGVPYARIGNTMFGLRNKINMLNSKIIKRNSFVLNLKSDENEIFINFHRRLKRAIKKAQDEKVEVKDIDNKEELEEYYKLSLDTEKNIQKAKGRKTFFIQKYEFFKKLLDSGIGRVIVAKFEGKIIAGGFFLVWKDKAVYFQACSDINFRNKEGPSIIQWEAIKKFKKEGLKKYDLGGVTLGLDEKDSRYFVYEFKRKFEGELIEFYNIEFELNRFKRIQDGLIKLRYGI